ncbi:fumarylacetoacetate hydrolase family protein, partial [Bacteroides fragilis]|nr:fumarylacetoacetate hydrolase family protein [Bacteroides fragilis]
DDLIFSVAELIAFCSKLYPLNPGDVIVTGTPEAWDLRVSHRPLFRTAKPSALRSKDSVHG